MKTKICYAWIAVLTACAVTLAAAAGQKKGGSKTKDLSSEMPPDAKTLNLGDPAPDFSLPGIDGKQHTLADYASAKLLMVVFLSNHCPYSHAAETRLIPLARDFKGKGLEVVAI